MASLCDFVNNDGTVTRDQAVAAIIAANEGRLDQSSAETVASAYNNDQVVNACVGGGDGGGAGVGVSPTTIGLGVLGLGAVVVALSQRDE